MQRSSASLIFLLHASGILASDTCVPCHAAIVKSYRETPMARSTGPAGADQPQESLAKAEFTSGTARFRVFRDVARLQFSIEDGGRRAVRSLDCYIGSGLVGRSYLSAIDGFLFQAPVSYYSSPKRWDVSPGFETRGDLALTRAVEPGCLRCHASRLQPIFGTTNGYASPPWLEAGVSCERCHGPGDSHIASIQSGRVSDGLSIINPAKLDAGRRDSVCAQCHLAGLTEIAKRNAAPYQPGGVLSNSSIVFIRSDPAGSYMANSHFERLAQSACWRASDGKLWCGTCHNPHRRPAEAGKAAYYRSRCLTCHTSTSCKEKAHARIAAKDNCLQCHMPRTGMPTVRHAAATDHSIPRKPGSPPALQNSSAELIPFEGKAEDRELGLAYSDVALKENNQRWGLKAFELLRKAYEAHPDDLKVAAQLAQLYDGMDNAAKACELYASIVAADPNTIAPAVNLGACQARSGKLHQAIALWTAVLKRNPAQESARANLAVALGGTGQREEAKTILREGLRLDPLSRRLEALLREISGGNSN